MKICQASAAIIPHLTSRTKAFGVTSTNYGTCSIYYYVTVSSLCSVPSPFCGSVVVLHCSLLATQVHSFLILDFVELNWRLSYTIFFDLLLNLKKEKNISEANELLMIIYAKVLAKHQLEAQKFSTPARQNVSHSD